MPRSPDLIANDLQTCIAGASKILMHLTHATHQDIFDSNEINMTLLPEADHDACVMKGIEEGGSVGSHMLLDWLMQPGHNL